MSKQAAVIGGGLAGLSGAIHLARRGYSVDLFEKTDQLGGKMNGIRTDGFRFDTGPSLLTMPFVLDELFADAGCRREDYLTLLPIEPMCRYFFSDRSQLDASANAARMEKAIAGLAPQDSGQFHRFMAYSRRIYDVTAQVFLYTPVHEYKKLLQPRHLPTLLALPSIDAWRTVHKGIKRFFRDQRVVQLFDRYATYNGSNPYQAPATLNIIPYVEYGFGGFYIKGGMYQLVKALTQVAEALGVRIHTQQPVEEIFVRQGRVAGLRVNGAFVAVERVLCNMDVVTAFAELLPGFGVERKRLSKLEPSLSGMIFLWGVNKSHPQLAHHNIFFSADYHREFEQIFRDLQPPDDPTVYVAITSRVDAEDAPTAAENWFVLVNMPYLSDRVKPPAVEPVRRAVLQKLHAHGLKIEPNITVEKVIRPQDFRDRYASNSGSIYGLSSNSRSMAFRRPANRSRALRGLYFAGGSSHPGGGIPLVLLSGKMAADLIAEQE